MSDNIPPEWWYFSDDLVALRDKKLYCRGNFSHLPGTLGRTETVKYRVAIFQSKRISISKNGSHLSIKEKAGYENAM